MLAGYDVPSGLSNDKMKESTCSNYEHKSFYMPVFDKLLFEHALCVNSGLCAQKQTLKNKPNKDKRNTRKKMH